MMRLMILSICLFFTCIDNAQNLGFRHKINGGLGKSYRLYNNPNDYLIESIKSDFMIQYQYRISKKKRFFVGFCFDTSNPADFDSLAVLNLVNSGARDLAKFTSGFLSYSLFGVSVSYVRKLNKWKFSNTIAAGPILTVKDDVVIEFSNSNLTAVGGYDWGKGIRNQFEIEYVIFSDEDISFGLSLSYTMIYGNANLNLENREVQNGTEYSQKYKSNYTLFQNGFMFNFVFATNKF